MKKKARQIVVCVMVVMSIFAVCSTAFAAGETLNHSGTAKNSYYTTNSVPQKTDTRLHLNSHTKNPSAATVKVSAVWKVNGAWKEASTRYDFAYPCNIAIPIFTGTDPRDIHLWIINSGSYVGKSVSTSGNWTLYKN